MNPIGPQKAVTLPERRHVAAMMRIRDRETDRPRERA
jgi:hypothetical protein